MKTDGDIEESVFKVLLVGDVGVGKTSIMRRVCLNVFSRHYGATIGVDFMQKKVKWSEKHHVYLQLWDIAGQERCGAMTHVFYKEASAAFVVFDVTRKSSLDIALQWKEDIDKLVYVSTPKGPIEIPVVLLANKYDLYKGEESVESENHLSQEEFSTCENSTLTEQKSKLMGSSWTSKLDKIVKEKGFVSWFPTSAKDDLNLDASCQHIIHQIIKNEKHFPRQSVEDRRALLLLSMGLSQSPSTLNISLAPTTSAFRSNDSNVTLVNEKRRQKEACQC